MYRLLIVTENQQVEDMFSQMQGWETMGFKPPRVRSNMQAAVECMQKHAIDAIAVDDSPALVPFLSYLDEAHPVLPIFQIETTPDAQWQTIKEVYRLLSSLKADHYDNQYDSDSCLERMQEQWLKKVMAGLVLTKKDMQRQLTLYRSHMRMNVPCVVAKLSLPEGNEFINQRWHYGSDRLEIALGNFFGKCYEQMQLHVMVFSPCEVRILCYPENEEVGLSENVAYDFIQNTVEQIQCYLEVDMKLEKVHRLRGLSAFVNGQDEE